MLKKTTLPSRFSAEEDEILIEFVSYHSLLYDLKDVEYKNTTKKDLLWLELGKTLNKEGVDCKKRWRSIRDHYKRVKKEEKSTTGSAAKKKRAVYWDTMRFLDEVDDERDSLSNVSAAVIDETSNSSEHSDLDEDKEDIKSEIALHNENISTEENQETTSSAKRRRSEYESKTRQENLAQQKYLRERKEDREEHFKRCVEDIPKYQTPQQSDNEIDLFFMTMAATVKKFRPDLVTQTKINVFKVVTQMELLNQQPSASNTSVYPTNISYEEFRTSSPSYSNHSVNDFALDDDVSCKPLLEPSKMRKTKKNTN